MKPTPKPSVAGDPTPWIYRHMGKLLSPLERLLGIDCRTFTRLASRRLDEPLGLKERAVYRVHRLICSLCRVQDDRAQRLADVLQQAAAARRFDAEGAMPDEAKRRVRLRVMDELAKGKETGD